MSRQWIQRISHLLIYLMMAMVIMGCNPALSEKGLTEADFSDPVEADEDHNHDDHDHESELEEPAHGLTETGDEGVFIDHHGNRIVDELYQKYEQDGLLIEFTVENFLGVGGRGGEVTADIRSGERALIKFRVTDVESGEEVSGLQPLAWLDLQAGEHDEGDPESQNALCKTKTEGFLSGQLTARPTVDLNSFFILALNDDASVSVIDPTVNVSGMTQLFALIQLTGKGEDWALSDNQDQLWITIPSQNQVAITELDGFALAHHVEGGQNPARIVFQPDQRYVWVGNDVESGAESGVTVFDAQTREVVKYISTGPGRHEIAFSPDSRLAYITNSTEGTVSIVATSELEKLADIAVGRSPAAIDVAAWNGMVYVADDETGIISVLNGADLSLLAEIDVESGITDLAFAPDERWAFVTNPQSGTISVVDASSHRVTHVARVEGGPDQISFGQNAVYFRAVNANGIYAISLDKLHPTGDLELVTIPIGDQAPGQFPAPSLAPASYLAHRAGAMVIANPADDQIYFYPEGGTAPSGSFQGHTLRPRAVSIVDRSLREETPGVYAGRIRVPASGHYLVPFMVSDPFIVHCFEFEARPGQDQDLGEQSSMTLTMLNQMDKIKVGESSNLRFRLTEAPDGEAVEELTDLTVVIAQMAGNWNDRQIARDVGEGVYEITLTLPRQGLYSLFFAVPSRQINIDQLPIINIQVTAN